MENKRIIYKTDDGIAVITPAQDCPLTLEQIALKDVPSGVAYKIIDVDDLPQDRELRQFWHIDDFEPDGVGADYGVGSDWDAIGWGAGNGGTIYPVLLKHRETGETKQIGGDS